VLIKCNPERWHISEVTVNKVQLTGKKVSKLQTSVAFAAHEFPPNTKPSHGRVLVVGLAGILNEIKAIKAE